MPAGLQCWDERGRLAVDLTDFELRYVDSGSIGIPSNQTQITIPYFGVSPETHVVFVTSSPPYSLAIHIGVVSGGIRAYTWYEYGLDGSVPFGFDLYRYA